MIFNFNLIHVLGIFVLVNGLCGTFGQLLLTISLKLENAGPVSLARTIDIVMAFVYQICILNQHPQISSIIGALIICFGVVMLALRKWYQQKPELFQSMIPCKSTPKNKKSIQTEPQSIKSNECIASN